jgi:hypothetical protein
MEKDEPDEGKREDRCRQTSKVLSDNKLQTRKDKQRRTRHKRFQAHQRNTMKASRRVSQTRAPSKFRNRQHAAVADAYSSSKS